MPEPKTAEQLATYEAELRAGRLNWEAWVDVVGYLIDRRRARLARLAADKAQQTEAPALLGNLEA